MCHCFVCFINVVNELMYFTFFPSSVALASLVSTLVWSTMLSVEKINDKRKENEKRKSKKGGGLDKSFRPAHVWLGRHRTLQSGTCCVRIYFHKLTHRTGFLSPSLPLSHYSKSRTVRPLWKHLITIGCYLLHGSSHPYLQSLQDLCLSMCVW